MITAVMIYHITKLELGKFWQPGVFNLELICTSEFFKKLKLHQPLRRVQFRFLKNSTSVNYVPVNSKTAHSPPLPPAQSPGIWLTLSSGQWGIWPKMRPAQWGIWLSCQNLCQQSQTKGFCNSLIQHMSRVHGSLLLSIPSGPFCFCRII